MGIRYRLFIFLPTFGRIRNLLRKRENILDEMFSDSRKSVVSSERVIYTASAFAKESLLYLQEIGSLTANRPHVSRRSNLESFLFFMVMEGEGTLRYQDEDYRLGSGDCVFIDCRLPYSHKPDEKHLWKLRWIHFNGAQLPGIYEKYVKRGGSPAFYAKNFEAFSELFFRLFRLSTAEDYIRDMRINSGLSELVERLMELSWNPLQESPLNARKDIVPIKQYLDEHFTEKISLDELSALFFVNKFYLSRLFKEAYGMPVNAYLQQLRVTKAKKMLRFTDESMETIGMECGIGEANYFCRLFRKVEGISPNEYRRMWRSR